MFLFRWLHRRLEIYCSHKVGRWAVNRQNGIREGISVEKLSRRLGKSEKWVRSQLKLSKHLDSRLFRIISRIEFKLRKFCYPRKKS